ncbi:MAG: hypothetical protein ACR2LF_10865 [Jatrophihabitantaceae bacterium]
MTELDGQPGEQAQFNHTGSLTVAVLAGLLLALTARAGATQLLVAVAVLQAVLAFAWVLGTALPGRRGGLVIAAACAAAADVTVSVWPHGRLGTLLAVLGLAVPAMFVHQLSRGAVRVRAVDSLGGIALLVLAEVALPALLQLRHEFGGPSAGGLVVAGVAAAVAGALVVGYLVDMIIAAPRFDPEIPRGLLALVASAGLGGSIGYLMMQAPRLPQFANGRGAFVGAALGALVALLAVGAAFVEQGVPMPDGGFAQRVRPVLGVLVPISVLAPVAFLLCLAIRV